MSSRMDSNGDSYMTPDFVGPTLPSARGPTNVAPRTSTFRGEYQTAFGFPTIHKVSKEKKEYIWHRAGVPMNDTGCHHTQIMENEKLVPKENHLQNSYKIHAENERMAGLK